MYTIEQPPSRKIKREFLNETPSFLLSGLYICVDFNLRNQKTKQNVKKPNEIIFR